MTPGSAMCPDNLRKFIAIGLLQSRRRPKLGITISPETEVPSHCCSFGVQHDFELPSDLSHLHPHRFRAVRDGSGNMEMDCVSQILEPSAPLAPSSCTSNL